MDSIVLLAIAFIIYLLWVNSKTLMNLLKQSDTPYISSWYTGYPYNYGYYPYNYGYGRRRWRRPWRRRHWGGGRGGFRRRGRP